MDDLELGSDDALVAIAPGLGGAITGFAWRGTPLLRPAPAGAKAPAGVRLAACYPLVPYSNRIRESRLTFERHTYALARNFGAHPHAIHGVGWQRAWEVVSCDAQRAQLALDHDPRGDAAAAWPWAFRATQTFSLARLRDTDARTSPVLSVTLTIVNTGATPFPFGLGFHPFFVADEATKLDFGAAGVWENDATQLPMRHIAVPEAWRFDRPRARGDLRLDNVFTGWDGHATLTRESPGLRVTMTADRACRNLVVYAPAPAGFVALEPVTHETDAFNRHANGARDTGFRILRPGRAFSCTMRVAASALD
ncbi:MAG: aldose 1-epimerase [Betaproteobacteria bacterium]